MEIEIRNESPGDADAVRTVNRSAFDTPAEAALVDALRANGNAAIELVAEVNRQVVGHILFSPMSFDGACDARRPLGLAPMAVIPAYQRMGIGSRLVEAGLEECRRVGCEAVFVLGHPAYYPRFGFVPASRFGVRSTYDAPDEAFMAIELVEGALNGASGLVRYCREFDGI